MKPQDQAIWTESFDKLRETDQLLYAARMVGQDSGTVNSLSRMHRQALADYKAAVERIDA